MYLENVVIDAVDPVRLGTFWAEAVGAEFITGLPDLVEARLMLDEQTGAFLDLCLPQVPEPPADPQRLHLDLHGGDQQDQVVRRLTELGARPLDIGQGPVPWTVLADVEGNPFCVMEDRPEYRSTGPIAGLPLDSSSPDRDAEFWAELSGWTEVAGKAPHSLQHPSGHGPLLELCPEPAPKQPGIKNRMHLDVRLQDGESLEGATERVRELGGSALDPDWGDLPWQVCADPSGNEFCLLPAAG
jgi:predicted enzyme related to lactoylglutathione lyase